MPRDLKTKKFSCGCFPEQEVTITKGLSQHVHPTRITVVDEYENVIVFCLETEHRDEWSGTKTTSSYNFTLTKRAMATGEAVVKDVGGRVIRPEEIVPERKGRKDDKAGKAKRRPGDRGGFDTWGSFQNPRYEDDSLI